MSDVTTTYDGGQHCTATDAAKEKSVAMDCPYTGNGEELSPGNLLEAALAGCMMISMGPTATREGIDLTGASISVDVASSPPPKIDYTGLKVHVNMPAGLTELQRTKLERAADTCPIKHSFKDEIELSVAYHYPD
mgnify:CR=1 FL=1